MKKTLRITPLVIAAAKPHAKEYNIFDSEQPKLALRVQPGGTRTWVCWKREAGKTRRITLGNTEILSSEAARRACLEVLSGKEPTRPKKTLRFSELWSAFRAAKEGVYQPTTLHILEIYMNVQLLPRFGDLDLLEINSPLLAEWFYTYSITSPGGANQALGHFCTLFNWAKRLGHIPHDLPNPAAAIRRNRSKRPGRMLNSEQLTHLARVLESAGSRYRDAAEAVRLILLTGCRSGEILRLRWCEVKHCKLTLSHTKTGPRDVMLNTLAIKLLNARRKRKSSPYVFPSQSNPTIPRSSITASWKRFKRLAGLPPSLRLHDLRHTYASHALLSGESLFTTGKLLGHANTNSTARYAHLAPDMLAKAADQCAITISNLMDQG